MTPNVTFWKGRPVKELSREELLEAVQYMADRLAEFQSPSMIRAMAVGKGEMLRRGER